jgi:AraC-like DNA-binding protein
MSYINFRLIKSYFLNEKSEVNFTILTANWLLLIVALFCLTPLKYLLQILSCLIDGTVIVNYKYQLINSIICIIIFVYLLIYPTNLEEAEEKNRKRNNSIEIDKKIHSIWKYKIDLSKLNSADLEVEKRIAMKIDFYIKRINSIDYDNNILLKKGTTISDLALELKIPKSHLNFIFKYNCSLSFVTFKNLIRIEKSKKLIESDYLEFNTLNSLAEKVGFKSYDPFFKSFKEVTGIGPMEYRISNKKNKNLI